MNHEQYCFGCGVYLIHGEPHECQEEPNPMTPKTDREAGSVRAKKPAYSQRRSPMSEPTTLAEIIETIGYWDREESQNVFTEDEIMRVVTATIAAVMPKKKVNDHHFREGHPLKGTIAEVEWDGYHDGQIKDYNLAIDDMERRAKNWLGEK